MNGDSNPDDLLLSIFDNFPQEFSDYWGLNSEFAPEDVDPDEWEELKKLERLARRLTPIAATLTRPPRLPDAELNRPRALLEDHESSRTMLQGILDRVKEEQGTDSELWRALLMLETVEQRRYRFFLTCLQIHVAPAFMVWPGQVAENVVGLTRYVTRVRSGLALQYLARVSLCYLRDMPAELAVMARAALASLLEGAIDLDVLRRDRQMRAGARVGLEVMLDEARRREWLSADGFRAAQKVKEAGDDAAHVSPQLLENCDVVMEHLVVVLAELEAREAI